LEFLARGVPVAFRVAVIQSAAPFDEVHSPSRLTPGDGIAPSYDRRPCLLVAFAAGDLLRPGLEGGQGRFGCRVAEALQLRRQFSGGLRLERKSAGSVHFWLEGNPVAW
jgi:hypothetical protein